jgi:hypothetical protein
MMSPGDRDGQPILLLAFLLFAFAATVELIAISQAPKYCFEPAAWLYLILVALLWGGGVASLVVARGDRRVREGRGEGFALLVAIFVALIFIPTLGTPIGGCPWVSG